MEQLALYLIALLILLFNIHLAVAHFAASIKKTDGRLDDLFSNPDGEPTDSDPRN